MISAAIVTMTLLGCGDAMNDCEYISQSQETYTSQAMCEAAIPAMLIKMKDAPYAVITGRCDQAVNEALPQADTLQANEAPLVVQSDPELLNEAKPLVRVFTKIENGFAYVRTGTTNILANMGERTRNGLKNLAEKLKLRQDPAAQ